MPWRALVLSMPWRVLVLIKYAVACAGPKYAVFCAGPKYAVACAGPMLQLFEMDANTCIHVCHFLQVKDTNEQQKKNSIGEFLGR